MNNYVSIQAISPWQSFINRLFPGRWIDPPEDLDGFAPAYMTTEVFTYFDWKDRLRLLVSGKLRVRTNTKTDVIVSKMVSYSAATVLPPNYPLRSVADGGAEHG